MSPRIALSVITVEGRGASSGEYTSTSDRATSPPRPAGGRAGGPAGGRAERSVEGQQQQQQQARAEQLSDVEPRPDHGRLATGRGGRAPAAARRA